MMCSRFGHGYEDSKARCVSPHFPLFFCIQTANSLDSLAFRIFSAFEDAGHFLTAIFVVSGLAIPAVLAHIQVIQIGALLMSISGGVVVYGTILLYLHAFHGKKETTAYEVY